MRKKSYLAIIAAVVLTAGTFTGCSSISNNSTAEIQTDDIEVASDDAQAAENSSAETESETEKTEEFSSLDELNKAVGFTAHDLATDAYVPKTYEKIGNDVAKITYNHDGNTAVLSVSNDSNAKLTNVTGTETAEQYNLSDYGLTIDVQEADDGYLAEWTAMDMDGNQQYYALSENNVDIAVFENTLSTYAQAVFNLDQSDLVTEVQTDENGEKVTDETSSDENSSNNKEDTSSENSNGSVVASTTNNLDVFEYAVEEDGDYSFTDNVSDADTYWDIYVFDEKFDDALTPRYIEQSTSSSGKTPSTISLKKGQYVYCICNKNSFTYGGEKIDCNLQITKN